MNAVIAAVGIMLILSLCRVHVVVALIVGALAGGAAGALGAGGASLAAPALRHTGLPASQTTTARIQRCMPSSLYSIKSRPLIWT